MNSCAAVTLSAPTPWAPGNCFSRSRRRTRSRRRGCSAARTSGRRWCSIRRWPNRPTSWMIDVDLRVRVPAVVRAGVAGPPAAGCSRDRDFLVPDGVHDRPELVDPVRDVVLRFLSASDGASRVLFTQWMQKWVVQRCLKSPFSAPMQSPPCHRSAGRGSTRATARSAGASACIVRRGRAGRIVAPRGSCSRRGRSASRRKMASADAPRPRTCARLTSVHAAASRRYGRERERGRSVYDPERLTHVLGYKHVRLQ